MRGALPMIDFQFTTSNQACECIASTSCATTCAARIKPYKTIETCSTDDRDELQKVQKVPLPCEHIHAAEFLIQKFKTEKITFKHRQAWQAFAAPREGHKRMFAMFRISGTPNCGSKVQKYGMGAWSALHWTC